MRGILVIAIIWLLASAAFAGGSLKTTADFSVTATTQVIIAGDPARQCIIVTNSGSNPMRVGDFNTGASQGGYVAAGGALTLCTTSAIYGYSALGTTANFLGVQN
jgi:hypothetical protein